MRALIAVVSGGIWIGPVPSLILEIPVSWRRMDLGIWKWARVCNML